MSHEEEGDDRDTLLKKIKRLEKQLDIYQKQRSVSDKKKYYEQCKEQE